MTGEEALALSKKYAKELAFNGAGIDISGIISQLNALSQAVTELTKPINGTIALLRGDMNSAIQRVGSVENRVDELVKPSLDWTNGMVVDFTVGFGMPSFYKLSNGIVIPMGSPYTATVPDGFVPGVSLGTMWPEFAPMPPDEFCLLIPTAAGGLSRKTTLRTRWNGERQHSDVELSQPLIIGEEILVIPYQYRARMNTRVD